MNEIVLASRNPNKIQELKELLSIPDVRVLSTTDFPELEEVEEDAVTLEGNALKKAKYVAMVTGLPSLADDTGLEVTALNGAPGVYSARYSGEHASYEDNVEKLLSEMSKTNERNAQFRTVVALLKWTSNGYLKEFARVKFLGLGKGQKVLAMILFLYQRDLILVSQKWILSKKIALATGV